MEKYSAITFSYAINKDKSKYYKALEEIRSPLNQGDMTFYLIHMLELLSAGQKGIIDDHELNLMKLERVQEYMNNDKWNDYKDERELLCFIISMNVFVDEHVILSVQELMEMANKSRHIVNRVMDYFVQEGYVEVVSRKPKAYKVCDECLESILPS